jgi:hypothetical protein
MPRKDAAMQRAVDIARVRIFRDGENLIDSARLVSEQLSGASACG